MLLSFFYQHNEDFKTRIGHGRSKQSYLRYDIVYKHLRNHIRLAYHHEDIAMGSVTIQMINAFEKYLRVDVGLRNNTVWVYMIAFKHIRD